MRKKFAILLMVFLIYVAILSSCSSEPPRSISGPPHGKWARTRVKMVLIFSYMGISLQSFPYYHSSAKIVRKHHLQAYVRKWCTKKIEKTQTIKQLMLRQTHKAKRMNCCRALRKLPLHGFAMDVTSKQF